MKRSKKQLITIAIIFFGFFSLAKNSLADDTLLQSNSMTYLGAFTVRDVEYTGCPGYGGSGGCPQQTPYSGTVVGFNPNGNGGAGSILINGFNNSGGYIGEISIPTTLYNGDPSDWSTSTGINKSTYVASFLQGSSDPYFWDISEGHFAHVGSGGSDQSSNCSNGWGVGGLYVSGTDLYATSYCYYMATSANVLPLYKHTLNQLSTTGSYTGNYGANLSNYISLNAAGDFMSGALGGIPAGYQSQLGGTMLAGANSFGMSIIGRTSTGPSIVAFNPANFTANTLSGSVNGNVLASYPNDHMTLGIWGEVVNQYTSAADHYGALIFPPSSRSILVAGVHGSGDQHAACQATVAEGSICHYGVTTDDCSEVCGFAGAPACSTNTCGGSSRDGYPCCYDPAHKGGGHLNTSWPYENYTWAYDVGDSSGNNTTGNNVASMPSTATGHIGATSRNNLTAVKLGYVNPWDLYPYAVWNLPKHFEGAVGSGYASGTYDPVSGKAYFIAYHAQLAGPYSPLPVIEVYQVNSGSGADSTPPSAPSGLSVL